MKKSTSFGGLFTGAALAVLLSAGAATATPTVTVDGVTNQNDATPASSQVVLLPLGSSSTPNSFVSSNSLTLDGVGVSFSGSSGMYAGDNGNLAVSPFGLGNQTSNYLATRGSGVVTLSLGTAQTSFSLLWGSVDQGSTLNVINFYNGSSLVFSIDGDEVLQDAQEAGFTGVSSGADDMYISITGLPSFDRITFTDSNPQYAFEFVPDPPPSGVPEPATVAVLGSGLLALGFLTLRRRRLARA